MTNCPLPIYQGNVTNVNIDGLNVTYDVEYTSGNTTGSFFECGYTTEPVLLSVNEITKEYGATAFDFIPFGWLGYVADWITALGQKIQAQLTVIWLFINAPAEVTDLSFFTYIQLVLIALMGFGGFLAVRSGSG